MWDTQNLAILYSHNWKSIYGGQGRLMADGMWMLHDDGEFELMEPYATLLQEAKIESTRAWAEALVMFLEPRCPYTGEQLANELVRRNKVRQGGAINTFEEFVLEALGGDL